MQEVDAADVLKRYSEVLIAERFSISEMSALPYPKAFIKQVLLGGLRRFRDDESQKILGNAFLRLADFQELTDGEREAVKFMRSLPDASKLSTAQLKDCAWQIDSFSDAHSAVTNRQTTEFNQLFAELQEIQNLN